MNRKVKQSGLLVLLVVCILTFSSFHTTGKFKYRGGWETVEGDDVLAFIEFRKDDGASFLCKDERFIPKNTTLRYRIWQDGEPPHKITLNVHRANGDLIGPIQGWIQPIDKNTIEMKLKWDERPESFDDEEGIYFKLERM